MNRPIGVLRVRFISSKSSVSETQLASATSCDSALQLWISEILIDEHFQAPMVDLELVQKNTPFPLMLIISVRDASVDVFN